MYVNSACKGKVVDLIVLAVVGWTSKFTYRKCLPFYNLKSNMKCKYPNLCCFPVNTVQDINALRKDVLKVCNTKMRPIPALHKIT